MISTPNEVILLMITSATIAGMSAFAASFSAFCAWRAVRLSAQNNQASIYLRFRDQYNEETMLNDLHVLREWRDKYKRDFAKEWLRRYAERDSSASEVNSARRRVKAFFLNIEGMYSGHLISRGLAEMLLDFQGIDLFYEVVEPLTAELAPDYERQRFNSLRAIRASYGRHQPVHPAA